jgi:hypothetical protein
MKKGFLFYMCCIMLVACQENKAKTGIKEDAISAIDSNVLGLPVHKIDLEDDTVFADGSRPASWETAGITKVRALKVFIKDLQYMVANDNREEIAKMVTYPLNAQIKTKAHFLEKYEQLFNPAVKEAIAKVNPRQIFRNYKGVMLGNGHIWIRQFDNDFKIIAINN